MGTRRERMAIDAVGSSDRFFSFPPPLRQVRRSMAPSHCAGRVARSFLLLSSALCFFPVPHAYLAATPAVIPPSMPMPHSRTLCEGRKRCHSSLPETPLIPEVEKQLCVWRGDGFKNAVGVKSVHYFQKSQKSLERHVRRGRLR